MDPFGYRMSPTFDEPVATWSARCEHSRAQSAAQPTMAADQEEHFLPRLPFRKRNQAAVFGIPTFTIEGPDELFSYRNEVPIWR